uniref:Synembryn n=2 Tax=Parascaris univalens TaxID=6257 RepID=A0A915C7G6_PARUN
MSELNIKTVIEWKALSSESLQNVLEKFTEEITDKFCFSDVDIETRKELSSLFSVYFSESLPALRRIIIRCVRILARDSRHIEQLLSEKLSKNIIRSALLSDDNFPFDCDVLIEAEMCLINALFNCPSMREIFQQISCAKLIQRIREANTANEKREPINDNDDERMCCKYLATMKEGDIDRVAFYDLRIAFIISAHSIKLQTDWLALSYEVLFNQIVENSLAHCHQLKRQSSDAISEGRPHADRCAEALKILFNLFCHADANKMNTTNTGRCVKTCADIVALDDVDPNLEQAAVNVLATVPACLNILVRKVDQEKCRTDPDLIEYDGVDMYFVDIMLRSLNRRLDQEMCGDSELLGTYFTVLIHLCTQSKEARRFARLKVMPPLRAEDVERRPDVGSEFRNKVVRVMMSACNCRQLAAEFFFILCKRSVSRLLKYCGFGNAAGLLANYGFLGAINQPKRQSDSEDSETEDYKQVENLVNPVTGFIEPPHDDPLQGMSQEQKEYEAMQLVNAMSKLMDQGVISPGTVGEDGRLRPVKHVLELAPKDDPPDEEGSDID